jgi:hypothetical protein
MLNWHDRARLHYAQLLANPNADAGQKSEAVAKLNLVQVGGHWLTREELEAREQEAQAIQESLAKWRPRLKTLQQAIDGEDFAKRDRAIAELAKLDDPAMIPALESFLLDAKADFQEQAVKKLAEFKHYEATQALTRYAVLSDYSVTRDAAIASLKERPQHEFVPLLLAGLMAPVKTQYQILVDKFGRVAYSHVVFREGSTSNLLLLAQGLSVPQRRNSSVTIDKTTRAKRPQDASSTTRTVVGGKSFKQALREQVSSAASQAANVEAQANIENARAGEANRRVAEALQRTTGHQAESPTEWWTWWKGLNEVYWPQPTKYAFVSKASSYSYGISSTSVRTGTRASSCFLAGTPIRTESGIVPIESIQPGDRVLAQDQDSGELAYKVVLTTTLRPPAKMVEIKAGGENIYTTLGHPFWVAGRGWQMAKQLKAGDLLHGLAGATPIESINAAGEHSAHNLVVDDSNTYFVGRSGLLVHDNEFRKPTRAIVPGLVRN